MTWSQVIWKIQNRKRAQKNAKRTQKTANGRNLKKCLNWLYISEFPVFFFHSQTLFEKASVCVFFCGFVALFFADFCGFFCLQMRRCDVSRHANAWQSLAQRTKTQRFSISVPALMICTVVPGRVQRFEILHTCAGLEAVQYQAQVVHATRDREPFLHGLTMPICC